MHLSPVVLAARPIRASLDTPTSPRHQHPLRLLPLHLQDLVSKGISPVARFAEALCRHRLSTAGRFVDGMPSRLHTSLISRRIPTQL